jgi:TolB-like protein
MKRIFAVVLCMITIAAAGFAIGAVGAEDAKVKTVAVLPFDVHSSDNIDYIRNGVWDMLISRISLSGKIEVASKQDVLDAMVKRRGKGDWTREDVYALGKKMKVDYVVHGSITKIGNSVSLDGKLLDIAAYKSTVDVFSQSQGMDDVIPKIGDFAKRIDYQILGQVPSTFGAAPAPAGPSASAVPQPQTGAPASREEAIDAMKTRQGTFTAVINPEFINAPQTAIDKKGFWMSQRFDTEFKGMDIGDVDGDGINEIVVIDPYNVMIYQKADKKLKLLQKVAGESYEQYLSVDVADVTGSGKKEIIVTSINQTILDSFVLQYKDGKYVKIAKDLRWFLRVIEISGVPVLLGQKMGSMRPFEYPIHEIVWQKGKFVEGKRMNIPEGLSIYGLALEPLEKDGPNKIICLDDLDYLRVFEPTEKPMSKILSFSLGGGNKELLWKSDEHFGGSNNFFDLTDSQLSSTIVTDVQPRPYVNIRILAYDIGKKGKKDLIVVKNLSTVGRVFQNMKLFSTSEIYDLEWNGLAFAENWRTKKIHGYIADYQIKDIDNDGKPEVVLALVLSYDMGINRRSVLVAYTLNQP